MTTDDFPWLQHVEAGFDATVYCGLSTAGADGPWVNPVYFAHDGLSVYFVSLRHSRHMRNIAVDPTVAIAAFRTDQPPGEHVVGVQARGTAHVLTDVDVPRACDIYFAREGALVAMGLDVADPSDFMGDGADTWKFVRVDIDELSLFSSEYFGEERVEVPLDAVRRPTANG